MKNKKKMSFPLYTDNNIIENYSDNNLIDPFHKNSKNERKSNSQTFIMAGENVIKENRRQISAYYGQNSNNNIPTLITNPNNDKEYNKKRQLLFSGRFKNKNLKNQMIENSKMIKKIEIMRNKGNDNDLFMKKK